VSKGSVLDTLKVETRTKVQEKSEIPPKKKKNQIEIEKDRTSTARLRIP